MGFWDTIAVATGNGKLDRLCGQNDWSIDERSGDVIGLHFKGDRVTPRRVISVAHKEGTPTMSFLAPCRGRFHSLPGDLLPALLARNEDIILAAWQANTDGDGIALHLRYTALTAAVDAATFKLICSLMIEEVAHIENSLHRKGLL